MTRMAYYQKTWRLFYCLIYGGPKVSRQFQFTHGRCKKLMVFACRGEGGDFGRKKLITLRIFFQTGV